MVTSSSVVQTFTKLGKSTISSKTNKKFEPPSSHFHDEKKGAFWFAHEPSLIWVRRRGVFISRFVLSRIVGLVHTSNPQRMSLALLGGRYIQD